MQPESLPRELSDQIAHEPSADQQQDLGITRSGRSRGDAPSRNLACRLGAGRRPRRLRNVIYAYLVRPRVTRAGSGEAAVLPSTA